ncbi:hypothetical protein [Rhodococcus qingshengii]|uniref:hypothetical protein n=1 Tax=Rhodococcus qingshengii TaxID=334542 RepID=UPI0021B0D896|nr:hypothetical protein [Rhodococcus qingshengii]MCT6735382.1 hypothetical protein [Rhodococcus qingshengii]
MTTVDKRRQSALPQPPKRLGSVSKSWSPCTYDAPMWDLDGATFADAIYARSLCHGRNGAPACPLLAQCNAQIEDERPRAQVKGGRIFSHRGAELRTDRQVLNYLNRVAGQKAAHDDGSVDPLELVESDDFEVDSELDEQRKADREMLRSLTREVATTSGVQFTLDLGA